MPVPPDSFTEQEQPEPEDYGLELEAEEVAQFVESVPPKRTTQLICLELKYALDASDGEVTPTVSALRAELKEKVERCQAKVNEWQAMADAMKSLANDYAKKSEAWKHKALGLEDYVGHSLAIAGIKQVPTPLGKAQFRAGSERVEVDADFAETFAGQMFDVDGKQISLVRTDHSVDKAAIKELLKRGYSLPGNARLVRGAETFRLK